MKRALLWFSFATALAIAFLLYQSWSGTHLNVTPDARREIERAKRR